MKLVFSMLSCKFSQNKFSLLIDHPQKPRKFLRIRYACVRMDINTYNNIACIYVQFLYAYAHACVNVCMPYIRT